MMFKTQQKNRTQAHGDKTPTGTSFILCKVK